MSDTWTIGELAEHAALALRDALPPANGRVRDVPGARLIRWYTTIGLVDPPLTRRGRIAQYGRRHLLQLVAIKRLQAAGHSIAEIQAALAGATDRMLEEAAAITRPRSRTTGATPLADEPPAVGSRRFGPRDAAHGDVPHDDAPHGDVPHNDAPLRYAPAAGAALGDRAQEGVQAPNGSVGPGGGEDAADRGGDGRDVTGRGGDHGDVTGHDGDRGDVAGGGESGRGRFWAERPAKEVAHRAAPDGRSQTTTPDSHGPAAASDGRARIGPAGRRARLERRGPSTVVTGIRLGDGVRLVLDAGRTPSAEDVQAVLAAAGPLLAVLEERELT
ncbi:MerR family transcriptional regulator [Nonomuraea sp. H19]|uniref:helix-turn-helix domain-containing protein n=1 Tax=Nonomuraea sp. H19 TaxID=3452206 RepID=UPI003F8C05AF